MVVVFTNAVGRRKRRAGKPIILIKKLVRISKFAALITTAVHESVRLTRTAMVMFVTPISEPVLQKNPD
jgi:hypothetical protein